MITDTIDRPSVSHHVSLRIRRWFCSLLSVTNDAPGDVSPSVSIGPKDFLSPLSPSCEFGLDMECVRFQAG